MNEHETTALLARLADDCPVSAPPVDAVMTGGEHRVQSRRRVLAAAGAVAVLAIVVGASLGWRQLPSGNASGPTSPSTTTAPSGWEQMTGTALADALGLTPVPGAEVNQSVECSGGDGINDKDGLVFKGNPNPLVYCYLPADYGITDPVEAELLRWQLVGVPRSPDLLELARLEVRHGEVAVAWSDSANDVTRAIELADELFRLNTRIEELMHQMFPPNGNVGPWLESQTED
jgi:hypothetical protein